MTRKDHRIPAAVLFDLDGTLVDTAPDMVAALQAMRVARELPPIDYELARAQVSNGSAGLVRLGFPDSNDAATAELIQEFLHRYEQAVCVDSMLFAGLGELLAELEHRTIPWGVVTNKPKHLTAAVLAGLDLATRAACAISGDTIPQRKPHPAPLMLASREIGIAADQVVYIGDASRDIEAGRAAGMATIAVAYGYIPDNEDPASWGADHLADDPAQLSRILLQTEHSPA